MSILRPQMDPFLIRSRSPASRGGGDQLARRFAAEAGLNLVNALLAEDRKALLLVLDSNPDIEGQSRPVRSKQSQGNPDDRFASSGDSAIARRTSLCSTGIRSSKSWDS